MIGAVVAFFFFGTLRDPDVLALVLDRCLTDRDQIPALLRGHRTARAVAQPFPLLVPAEDVAVEGLALRRPSRRDEERITWFEEDEYRPEWRTVESALGPLRARVFFAQEPLRPSGIAWDFARWRREEKNDYLERCVKWMRELEADDQGAP